MTLACYRPYLLVLTLSLIWCTAALSGPLFLRSGHTLAASGVYLFFSGICHQDPARCFWLVGEPLPVCSRCLAIYSGFLGAVLVFPTLRGRPRKSLPSPGLRAAALSGGGSRYKGFSPFPWLLVVGIVVVALDAGLDWLGLRTSTWLSRSATGALLGFAGGWTTAALLVSNPHRVSPGR
jgi:uncharacterized membrane protein